MDKKEYIVENYVFTSIEQGRMAEKEKKMIELLIQKTDFNHKDALKNLYDNLVMVCHCRAYPYDKNHLRMEI